MVRVESIFEMLFVTFLFLCHIITSISQFLFITKTVKPPKLWVGWFWSFAIVESTSMRQKHFLLFIQLKNRDKNEKILCRPEWDSNPRPPDPYWYLNILMPPRLLPVILTVHLGRPGDILDPNQLDILLFGPWFWRWRRHLPVFDVDLCCKIMIYRVV